MFLRKLTLPSLQSHQRLYSSFDENSIALRIDKLKSKRLTSSQAELCRLESNPFICERMSQISQLYDKESMPFLEWNKIAYSRFLELFEICRHDHFVLSHGQSSSLQSLAILNGALLEARSLKPLLPFQVALGEATQFGNAPLQTIAWYKENITHNHTDHNYKNELLSVDAWPMSIAQSESALSFFSASGNRNLDVKERIVRELASRLLARSSESQSEFIAEFEALDQGLLLEARSSLHTLGQLYAICIPKKLDFESYAYLSQPCGIPFPCQLKPLEVLEDLQNKAQLDGNPLYDYSKPQLRVLRHKLLESNVYTFAFPTYPDDIFEKYVSEMRALLKKYLRPQANRYFA